MDSNKTLKITLVISILLHLLVILLYKPVSKITFLFPQSEAATALQQPKDQIIEFELVETPDDARISEPNPNAQFASDKNARAQDNVDRPDLMDGAPHSAGISDYKTFTGGGETIQAAPIPQEITPEQQEQQELDAKQEQKEMQDLFDLGDVQIFQRQTNPQTYTQKFDKNLLQGAKQKNNPGNPAFTDDAQWKNENFDAKDLGGVSLNTYEWDFAPYILYMKKRLRDHLFPPPAFYQMGAISGEVMLKFRVERDGKMTNLVFLSNKGHDSFIPPCMNSVKASDPFRPLPKSFPEPYLELTWTFVFTIYR